MATVPTHENLIRMLLTLKMPTKGHFILKIGLKKTQTQTLQNTEVEKRHQEKNFTRIPTCFVKKPWSLKVFLLFCIKALTSNKFFVNYRDEELIFLVLISIHHFTLPSSEVTEKDQLIH